MVRAFGGSQQDRASVRITGFDETWGHAEISVEVNGEKEDRRISFIVLENMTAGQMQIAALEAAVDELEAMTEVLRTEIATRKSG